MSDRRPLSPRERQVVARVAMRNAQIARELGISQQTVKNHLHAAAHALGVVGLVDRTGILWAALQAGELDIGGVIWPGK